MFKRFFSDIASILLPASCLVCGRRLHHACICCRCMPKAPLWHQGNCLRCDSPAFELDGSGICNVCRSCPPIFRQIRSAWEYNQRVQAAVTTMKYRPSMRLCKVLGAALGRYASAAMWRKDWDAIIPIPSSPQSLRKRGFNQAQIIGVQVQSQIRYIRKVPVLIDALFYQGTHKAQASLSHEARFSNARRMFSASGKISGKRVLLVDDVLTTGATSCAAGAALLRQGAKSVDLLTLARSTAWNEFRVYSSSQNPHGAREPSTVHPPPRKQGAKYENWPASIFLLSCRQ